MSARKPKFGRYSGRCAAHLDARYGAEPSYRVTMIYSFKDRDTEKLFNGLRSRIAQDIQAVALRKLRQLNAAMTLGDLTIFPGNRLERLKGNREGQHSIRINNQWRICFVWKDGDAYNVEIADYH